MGCFFSIFKFGSYVVKESDTNAGSPQSVNVPEIRKHSSTPISETTPKLQLKTGSKPKVEPNVAKERNKQKDKTVYTTTFEAQVDAAPPHPLEQSLNNDIDHNLIEIDTNLFTPEVEDAVVKIQAGFRGYLARKHVKELRGEDEIEVFTEVMGSSVVPPPKNFENSDLSAPNDLDKWKKLSQHLEDKANDITDEQPSDGHNVGRKPNGSLTEEIIPLNDSNDNKVIETYDCKENILDIDTTDETTLQKKTQEVIEKVFNVLMSETESEDIINFEDKPKDKIETSEQPIQTEDQQLVTKESEDNSQQTPESEVLAKLNEILENNDTNSEPIVETNQSLTEESDKPSEDNSKPLLETEIPEPMSTTQQIIKDSFQQFVKEMNQSRDEHNVQELPKQEVIIHEETKPEESQPKDSIVDSKLSENVSEVVSKPEERKTDSMIFEEEVVQTAFNEELAKNPSQNQIFAIEVFKQDVNEEQLANVTTLDSPEPTLKNIWGVEERAYKTSIDEFVVKPVETETPVEPIEFIPPPEVTESVPLLTETEQIIEIITSESRKNSEDLLESEVIPNDIQQLVVTEEVLPPPSPIIQIEEQNGRILDEEEAAIRIQAAFRGYQIRRSMSREASPNRAVSPNHNTDNNNNSFNDAIDVNGNTAEEAADPQIHSSQDVLIPEDNRTQLMSTSTEQINTSLEKLEDQLIHELISSAEEESRNQAILEDNLDTTQRLMEEMKVSSGELTAPLLLQRLQQSFGDSSVPHPEEQPNQELNTDSETNTIDESLNIEVDRPLIEKSDTIIDLLTSQTITKTVSFNDEIQSSPLQTNDDIVSLDVLILGEEEKTNQSHIISDQEPEVKQESNLTNEELLTEDTPPEPLKEPEVNVIDSVRKEIPSEPQVYDEPQELKSEALNDSLNTLNQEIIESLTEESIEAVVPQESHPTEVQEITQTEPLDEIQLSETQSPQTIDLSSEEVIVSHQTEPERGNDLLESVQSFETSTEPQNISESVEQEIQESRERLSPEPEEICDRLNERHRSVTFSDPENPEIIEYSKENSVESEDIETKDEPIFQSEVEPPTPDIDSVTHITPELSFVKPSEEAVLTKVYSSESEQEPEVIPTDTLEDSPPPPVLESNKTTNGEQKEQKRPKPILKETINTEEQFQSNSESISSPEDDNPEFVGLGPNTPNPVRASSPNPFGKKRRRGKKGQRKN